MPGTPQPIVFGDNCPSGRGLLQISTNLSSWCKLFPCPLLKTTVCPAQNCLTCIFHILHSSACLSCLSRLTLAACLLRTKWELQEIEKADNSFRLTYRTPEGTRDIRARCVALTVPAYVAADLLRRDCPDASSGLKSIDYPPVAAVSIAYPMSAIQQDRLDQQGNLPGEHSVLHAAFELAVTARPKRACEQRICFTCCICQIGTSKLAGLHPLYTRQ